jgi:hypothetical protein
MIKQTKLDKESVRKFALERKGLKKERRIKYLLENAAKGEKELQQL